MRSCETASADGNTCQTHISRTAVSVAQLLMKCHSNTLIALLPELFMMSKSVSIGRKSCTGVLHLHDLCTRQAQAYAACGLI